MRSQAGFWDIDERYVRLSEAGDPLEKLNAVVPWEVFRKPLAKALKRSDGAKGGRPPFDAVMMFKVLVLQALYSLSDDQAEFQLQDRLSFMRFLGLGLGDKVPDAKTIWLFREHLTQARAVENLFARFDKHLTKAGYLAMGGQIVDATIVAAPKQRNSDAEKADIKAGKVPDEWQKKPAKLRQKDRDARWTVKFSKAKADEEGKTKQRDIAVPAFGYKNHASIDRRHGFIRGWNVTGASGTGRSFATCWTRTTPARRCGPTPPIARRRMRRGWTRTATSPTFITRSRKVRPMSEAMARANGRRSKIRAFVEHVFAQQKSRMGLFVRTIGIARARTKIGMANLAYNLTRFVWHQGRTAFA
ncbi:MULTISPECIES: IS5 family transposase [Mesorhizobium]|uniref:Putative transposase n=1 Tax=Rhizobium loti TaxID=381 RepID=M5AMP5_RHILI|nr:MULTISPECIES: IS5 family transposase [Mesorhizobium]BAN09800.1 putative transposase [Mesorhizobium loti NZP2037]